MKLRDAQKAETHQKILDAASRVFCREGFSGGVAEVMREAGLTHGGFYAHFENKNDLIAAVVEALGESRQEIREDGLEGLDDWDWLRGLVLRYLSMEHRAAVEVGCLMPPLVSEISRHAEARSAFEKAFMHFVNHIATKLPGSHEANQQWAMRMLSSCVGGLALSRAVEDAAMANQLIEHSRAAAMMVIDAWEASHG